MNLLTLARMGAEAVLLVLRLVIAEEYREHRHVCRRWFKALRRRLRRARRQLNSGEQTDKDAVRRLRNVLAVLDLTGAAVHSTRDEEHRPCA